MSSDKRSTRARTPRAPGLDELREQYGCGPVRFTGTGDALYERHLMFDNAWRWRCSHEMRSTPAFERFGGADEQLGPVERPSASPDGWRIGDPPTPHRETLRP